MSQSLCVPNCFELLNNPILDPNQCLVNGVDAYNGTNSLIPGWRCSHGSPHYVGVTNTNQCFYNASTNGSPFPCLNNFPNTLTCIVTNTFTSLEGFYQVLNKPIINDPYVTYNVCARSSLMPCGNNNIAAMGILNIRATNAFNPNQGCDGTIVEGFYPTSPLLLSANITSGNVSTISNTIQGASLTQSYNKFWVLQPALPNGKTVAIYDLSLSCATSALTDITHTNIAKDFKFNASNASLMSHFVSYSWNFGDPASGAINNSTLAMPNHEFTCPGAYNVCLDIIDNNGCCGRRCEIVNVPNMPFSANFTIQDNCPNYTYTVANPMSNTTYTWTTTGGIPANGTGLTHFANYAENGQYTITLIATHICGQTTMSSQIITVNCHNIPASCTDRGHCLVIGTGPNSVTTMSSLVNGTNPAIPTTPGLWLSRNVNGGCYVLNGRLIIDIYVDFYNTHWFANPGAQIDVRSNGFNALNSSFQACDQMWKGFTLRMYTGNFWGYNIGLKDCTISDAGIGVDVGNGNSIVATNTHFNNNVIGIRLGVDPPANNIYNQINGCTFERLGPNLPAYPNQFDYQLNYQTGIVSNYVSLLNVRDHEGQQSNFIDLVTGIYVKGGNMEIQNSNFRELNFKNNSYGIRSSSTGGLTIIHNSKFTDMNRSIDFENGNRSTIFIYNNDFDVQKESSFLDISAVRIQLHPQSRLSIYDDNTFNLKRGIHNHILGDLSYLSIKNNTYFSNNLTSIPIYISAVESFFVQDNNFYGGTNATGSQVILNNCQLGMLTDNILNEGPNQSNIMFNIQGTDRTLFTRNESKNKSGFFNAMGSENIIGNGYCCNISSVLNTYATFSGDNGYSPFRQNSISTLTLDPTGEIGPQLNAGNIWLGTNSLAKMQGATFSRAQDNIFTVPPSGRPAQVITSPTDVSNQWFQNSLTLIPPTCKANPTCDIPPYFTGPIDPNLLPPLPDTPRVNPPPAEDCHKLLQAFNYSLSLEHSADPIDQLFYWTAVVRLNYYIQIYGAEYWKDCKDLLILHPNILVWDEVEDDIDHWDEPDFILESNAANVLDQINGTMANIDSLSSEGQYSSALFQAYSALSSQSAAYQTIALAMDNQRRQKAIQSISRINALPTPYAFLQDKKTIWIYKARIVAYGPASLTTQDWDAIRAVAQKCPGTAGHAVFEAISLMHYNGEIISPNTSCTRSLPRTKDPSMATKPSLQIIPNPASDMIEIRQGDRGYTGKITIVDLSGNIVLNSYCAEDQRLDISGLSPGIYQILIDNQNEVVEIHKFVKIK